MAVWDYAGHDPFAKPLYYSDIATWLRFTHKGTLGHKRMTVAFSNPRPYHKETTEMTATMKIVTKKGNSFTFEVIFTYTPPPQPPYYGGGDDYSVRKFRCVEAPDFVNKEAVEYLYQEVITPLGNPFLPNEEMTRYQTVGGNTAISQEDWAPEL